MTSRAANRPCRTRPASRPPARPGRRAACPSASALLRCRRRNGSGKRRVRLPSAPITFLQHDAPRSRPGGGFARLRFGACALRPDAAFSCRMLMRHPPPPREFVHRINLQPAMRQWARQAMRQRLGPRGTGEVFAKADKGDRGPERSDEETARALILFYRKTTFCLPKSGFCSMSVLSSDSGGIQVSGFGEAASAPRWPNAQAGGFAIVAARSRFGRCPAGNALASC